MNRRNRRSFLSKHRVPVLVASLLALSILAIVIHKQIRTKQQLAEATRIQSQIWPPVKEQLNSNIEKFDATIAASGVTEASLLILEETLKTVTDFRSEHKQVFLPGASEIVDDIQTRRQLYLADLWWHQSNEAEWLAKDIHRIANSDPDQIDSALKQMKTALALQNRINDEFPESNQNNYPRSVELMSWIQTLEAEPLFHEIQALKIQASHATEAMQWEKAKNLFSEMLERQAQINHQFPEAPQADFTEIVRIEDQVRECEAQLLFIQSESELSKALTYQEAEKQEQALELMASALDLQNTINLNYPASTLFSFKRAEQIATRIQLIKASRLVGEILKMDEELTLLISEKMVDKISYKLSDIARKFQELTRDYPLYQNPHLSILEKVEYLQQNFENLPSIYSRYTQLSMEKINAETGQAQLSELIPQELFTLVLGTNPSRNQNPHYPVDSVSFEEAQTFCTRINYLLSTTISLPTPDDLVASPFANKSENTQVVKEWLQPIPSLLPGKSLIFEHGSSNGKFLEKEVFFRSRSVGFRIKQTSAH